MSPRIGFDFIIHKFARKWKRPFSNAQSIRFKLKVAARTFSKISSISNFRFEQFSKLFLLFPENSVNFSTQIILLKRKNCRFQTLEKFVFDLIIPSNLFSRIVPMTNFWSRQFWRIRLTFPENDFNLSLKKFQESKKKHFRRLRAFRIILKIYPLTSKILFFWEAMGISY